MIDPEIRQAFDRNPEAFHMFLSFPPLYQRVRIDCIQRDKRKDRAVFCMRLKKLIERSGKGEMYGEWDDYGRLS